MLLHASTELVDHTPNGHAAALSYNLHTLTQPPHILSYHFISQLWICVSSLISILRYLSRPFGLGAWLDLVSFILLMAREDDLGDFLTCIDGTFRHASTSVALLGRFLGWFADV
jgi:hypothetical protein